MTCICPDPFWQVEDNCPALVHTNKLPSCDQCGVVLGDTGDTCQACTSRSATPDSAEAVESARDYIDRRITEQLDAAYRCPNCGPGMLNAAPNGPGAWCPVCGWSRPTLLPEPDPSPLTPPPVRKDEPR